MHRDGITAHTALTRRLTIKGLAAAGLTWAAMPLCTKAHAEEQATYFGWTVYDDPKWYGDYVAKYGQPPTFVLFSDEAEAYIKLRAGFKPDVMHPCSYNTKRWKDAGLLQPIDTSRLSNWPDIIPELKNMPGTVYDGQQYFIPWDVGNLSVLYRTDLVDNKANSLGLLWDERYKGRISVLDIAEDAVALAAMYAGFDPFKMTAEQTATVRELLEKQRSLTKFYSSDSAIIEQGLASGELVAAMAFGSNATNLKSQGVPVEFMSPIEGRLTWVCGLVLSSNAPHLDKAYDVLNAMIAPETGARAINDLGYGHCNGKAYDKVSDKRLQELGLSRNPADFLGKGIFLDDYHNRDEIVKMFESVKSGL